MSDNISPLLHSAFNLISKNQLEAPASNVVLDSQQSCTVHPAIRALRRDYAKNKKSMAKVMTPVVNAVELAHGNFFSLA